MRFSLCKAVSLLVGGAALLAIFTVIVQHVGHHNGPHFGFSNVALNYTAATGEAVPLNITFWYPTDGVDPNLPVLHFFNGFNVDAYWYSLVLQTLAGKGYLSSVLDYRQQSDWPLSQPPRAGCSNSTVDVVTAGGFSRAWQYLFSSEEKPKELASASATANSDSAVLLAHSYGGAPGFDVLFGVCDDASKPHAKGPFNLSGPCDGYTPVVSKEGGSVVRGVVGFETVVPGLDKFTLPPGTFVTEIAGEYASSAEQVAKNISGNCTAFVQLNHANHYGICDFNPSNPHQVSSCGPEIDGSGFVTDRQTQEAGVLLVADVIDASIKSKLFHDQASITYLLEELPQNSRITKTSLKKACYDE